MKYTLLIFTALLSFNIASAQKIVLGLNVGPTYSSTPSDVKPAIYYASYKTISPHFSGSLYGLIDFRKYQLGISYSLLKPSFKGSFIYYYSGPGFASAIPIWGDINIADPLQSFKLFLDRKFKLSKITLSIGISAGYAFFNSSAPSDVDIVWTHSKSGTGSSFGLLSNITYYITKHIGLNAGFNWDQFQMTTNTRSYIFSTAQLTAGVRYRF